MSEPPSFVLHPQLTADTLLVGDLELSRLLLMNDSRYPWLILVPRRANLVEIVDLEASDRAALIEEIARCSADLRRVTACQKLNIGTIGNRVAQLHVHIVGPLRARCRLARSGLGSRHAAPLFGRERTEARYGRSGGVRDRACRSSAALRRNQSERYALRKARKFRTDQQSCEASVRASFQSKSTPGQGY